MDGNTSIRRDGEKTKFPMSYKGQETMKSHDCPHPKGTRHIEKKNLANWYKLKQKHFLSDVFSFSYKYLKMLFVWTIQSININKRNATNWFLIPTQNTYLVQVR